MSEFLSKLFRSKVILQFVIVAAVYAIVIGGSYPVMMEAQREEQINHYPDKLTLEENLASRRYAKAEPHPEQVDEYLAAGDQMGQVLIREQKFDKALDIYQKQLAATWGLVQNGYNPRWLEANLKVAGVLRDMSLIKAALTCYQAALDMDKKYLPAGDPKVARDLNNIGLMHYLQGLSQADDKDRKVEFKQSIDNYTAALAILDKHPGNKTAIAANMWNLYLAERDFGDQKAAEGYRKQAQSIDTAMSRVCRAP